MIHHYTRFKKDTMCFSCAGCPRCELKSGSQLKKIKFVNPLYEYRSAVHSIVNPVANELVKYCKVPAENVYIDALVEDDESVHVYSFFGDDYLKEVGGLRGTTVHLAHGVADKDYRTAERMDKFDYCVVEGKFYEEKLLEEGFPQEKMLIAGFPKFALLSSIQDDYDKLHSRAKMQDRPINVLYAPTHSGKEGNLCSLAHHKNGCVVEKIDDPRFDIRISSHPHNCAFNKCTLDDLVWADVVVSDCSSVIYEAWHLGKPVVFLDFLVRDHILRCYPKSTEARIYTDYIGRHVTTYKDAIDAIRDAGRLGITAEERLMLNWVSYSVLRYNSPKILAKKLAVLGGYEV